MPEIPEAMMQEITAKLCGEERLKFTIALDHAIQKKFQLYQQGIERYQQHSYQREVPETTVSWSLGSACLREINPEVARNNSALGYPIFVIPSLVNRYYILDLIEKNSFLRWLGKEGWRPFVMDWGAPGETEKEFGLENYICEYLVPALRHIKKKTGRPPIVLGYCMGGTLSVALAELCQEDICSMVLMASPWDFHNGSEAGQDLASDRFEEIRVRQQGAWLSSLLPIIDAQGEMPHQILQALFASLDLTLSLRKFSTFTRFKENSDEERRFVALEDWLNDGVCLTAKVSKECFEGWYSENTPEKGNWHIDGKRINPANLNIPNLSIISSRDRIVPSASSYALAKKLSKSSVLDTPLGHIGMVVSRGAQSKIWTPLSSWMKQNVT
ncbi:alpha/beta fold hydrolase [Kiloniella antarctica]|uniref:Alpha/beta fold hydrolase n=1 Tax=Kiloniella antarctica TaxID=1550907 RepID=A0ABW5BEC5_9PROT